MPHAKDAYHDDRYEVDLLPRDTGPPFAVVRATCKWCGEFYQRDVHFEGNAMTKLPADVLVGAAKKMVQHMPDCTLGYASDVAAGTS